jgi:hypothetical protein
MEVQEAPAASGRRLGQSPEAFAEEKLTDFCAEHYADPLGFVLAAFPWGEPGPLANYAGPDTWQAEFLEEIGRQVQERGFDGSQAVAPIRMAAASGHGVGKSTIVGWLTVWLMSTRPNCRGTVTANTFVQLRTKTWAAIQKWAGMCCTRHWFRITLERMEHVRYPQTWFCSAQTCREENSEAFAGQHAADSSSFYVFDEASAIPDPIWEVAEGGLTDGSPFWIAFGNPTRNNGAFYRAVFGSDRNRWSQRSIDSRTAAMTNKQLIEEWITTYGEDSDFVRVRVRGLPPAASDLQFIDQARIFAAQQRPAHAEPDDPLVVGVDVARGGGDWNVIRFRRGLDARSIPAIRVPGEETRDTTRMVTLLGSVIERHKPDMVFVDGTGIGGPIVDRMKQLGHKNVIEIQFGWKPPDAHYLNMRAYMWWRMKEWLLTGAIDASDRLEIDLTGPSYHHDKQDRVVLEAKEEMKRRGLDSPDDADALCLTWAQVVGPRRPPRDPLAHVAGGGFGPGSWMA